MVTHSTRSKKSPRPGVSPTTAQIFAARERAGLTQTEAGAVLFTSCRVWQQWEAGDRRMHPAFFELFQIKVKGAKS